MNKLLKGKIYNIEQWLWFAIWLTLPLSIRANSLVLLLSVLIITVRWIIKPNYINWKYLLYSIPPILYFAFEVLSTGNRVFAQSSIKEIEQHLPLIVFPLLFLFGRIKLKEFKLVSLNALLISLLIAGTIMITSSVYNYFLDFDHEAFIYHGLSYPFSTGAIFFSFFIVILLLRIDEIDIISKTRRVKWFVICFLVILLLLSSSKLFIVAGSLFVVIKYFRSITGITNKYEYAVPIIFVAIVILLIPVGKRVSELTNPRFDIVMDQSYKYDSPLNGLNLRLIQARYGLELLSEHNSWLFGLGIDRSQDYLNVKYKETGIYSGYEGTEDTGYQNYNYHNQYIESLVRTGITGLILLLVILVVLLKTNKSRLFVTNWEIWLLMLFFLTESVLERQIGIVYFCIIYSAYFPYIVKLGIQTKTEKVGI